ncbi:unnamed protein product, partial [marine sediment metagenome]
YLAFHYAEDDPKDFTVSENLYSMVSNPDGSEKTDKYLQRPISIGAHAQGMKTDFIYGNWELAQNETLEIDPATATLDDPTEDGYISWDGAYTRKSAYTTFFFGGYGSASAWVRDDRGYIEWNISSLF